MKKFTESILAWAGISFIYACFLYCVKWKLNITIMWHDIKTVFRDCDTIMKLQLAIPIIILLAVLIRMAMKHHAYAFDISVILRKRQKQFHIRICYLETIHKYGVTLTVLIMLLSIVIGGWAVAENKQITVGSDYLKYPMVLHAMGEIDGLPYSNSKEAFEKHYSNGQRIFETDFCLTADDRMVARHDWGEGWQDGIDEEHIPTESIFLSKPIYGKYTPLSLEDVIRLMQQYPDAYIVSDTKDEQADLARKEIGIIVQTAKEMQAEEVLDRFVVQIYSPTMYESIKDLHHFPNYIFTLYMIWTKDEGEFTSYCRFCNANGIKTIAMWDYRLRDNPHLAEIAKEYGVEIYVHTVNDQTTAEEAKELGASGIYTDNEELFDKMVFEN